MKTPLEIINQYPYIGSFLSSAQGTEVAITLMEEYAAQFVDKELLDSLHQKMLKTLEDNYERNSNDNETWG